MKWENDTKTEKILCNIIFDLMSILFVILSVCCSSSVDNMEASLLADDRTDLVSTNRLRHGWAY